MWGQLRDPGEALTPHLIFMELDPGGQRGWAALRDTQYLFRLAELGKGWVWCLFFFFLGEEECVHAGRRGWRESEQKTENLQQSPQRARSATRGSIPQPREQDPSQKQESDAQPTVPPRCTPFSLSPTPNTGLQIMTSRSRVVRSTERARRPGAFFLGDER